MIVDNDPLITRHISIPREMSQLNCSALTAGIVEAVLDGLGFVSQAIFHVYLFLFIIGQQPARVSAHSVPTEGHPLATVILIKLDRSVVEREEALK